MGTNIAESNRVLIIENIRGKQMLKKYVSLKY